MANWDVFHSDRGEVERDLTGEQVRAGLAAGSIHEDDLVRPAGTGARWTRLADVPEVVAPEPEPYVPGPEPEDGPADLAADPAELGPVLDDEFALRLDPGRMPGVRIDGRDMMDAEQDMLEEYIEPIDDEDEDEDEEAAEFTLARSATEKIEELDLAAMVDVAFQMVLFFMVTATTVMYKSLEVPKPNPEQNEAVKQNIAPKVEDLQSDYILVSVDANGVIRVDKEPAAVPPDGLIEKLRQLRESSGRKKMLLTADSKTMHKNTVLAIDAANEIGLGLGMAKPTGEDSSATPTLVPAAAPAKPAG
ncbi:MAG TPA: biopolymer transporter ExbD [Isosphaeraceae bacterium]|jgi:biopolymer transport protein ExbD|nr:biopolymer transporter ExbD [Isosphaeraceae bacterium]